MWAETTPNALVPHSMALSRNADNYRLYWGLGPTGANHLLYINLSRDFANPRQHSGGIFGEPTYTGELYFGEKLYTSTFDAGMKGYRKLASSLDVTIRDIPATGTLTVLYTIDGGPSNGGSAGTLGTVTTVGTTSLPFGTLAAGIYPGMTFERISFEFRYADVSDDLFVMESAVLSFVPLKPSSYSWTIRLNLDDSHGGLSPADIIAALDSILDAGVLVPFVLRGTTYRVFLSQVQGALDTGASEGGERTISLLQIPQTLGAG
jgi:hypothetical protein